MGRGARDRWLDAATGLLLVAALGVFAQERLLPEWRAREVVEVGERIPARLPLRALASEDTLLHVRGTPALLLVFRSDCPACRRNTPAWRELLRRMPVGIRAYALAFEPAPSALRYVREGVPSALAVTPLAPDRFLRRFRVLSVPTTLYLDRDGRLAFHLAGPLSPGQIDALVARAGATAVGRGATGTRSAVPLHPSP